MIQPEQTQTKHSVVMSPELYATIQAAARARGMSFSEYVRQAARLAMAGELGTIPRENAGKTKHKKE